MNNMAELFKGMEGSPITYLTSDISANQTTISVADDSALPDAPNICTIGYGENLETIKYETKSNGLLQNVTRGIEGTAQAWQAGTEVARYFTAYDHNSIIENFTSHLAESANRWIVESGHTPDGYYLKYGDGTMICYNTVSMVRFASTALEYYWKFPKPFIDTPMIPPVAYSRLAWEGIGQPTDRQGQFYYGLGDNNLDETRLLLYKQIDAPDFEIGTALNVKVMAIGRWK